jgi:alkanesulfonate monooxygenase SsuD/methylene tetrahydromethanopterin reductase-like flavin-dependent oxidoreductase (luciferase family)
MNTEFGVRLPNSGPFATADNILDLAERSASLNFDSVWVHDHISWTRDKLTHFAAGSVEACKDQDPNLFESLTTAAAIGMRVPKIKVGIAGMILTLRDPRLLAKQIAAVTQFIGPDRLHIAFGVGSIPNDFEVMGVSMTQRGRIANDHIRALRAILDGEQPVTFTSKTLSFTNGAFYPRARKVSLWIAGGSEAARRRAAKHGDGWLVSPNGFPHEGDFDIREYADAVNQLRAFLKEEGRDAATFPIAIEIYISLAKTTQAALDIASHTLEHRFKSVKRGLAETIVGDSQTFIDRVRQFQEIGVRRFEVKFICHDTTQMAGMMAQAADAISRMGEPAQASVASS